MKHGVNGVNMCSEFLECGAPQFAVVFSLGLFVGGVFALRYLAPMIYKPVIDMETRRAADLQAKIDVIKSGGSR